MEGHPSVRASRNRQILPGQSRSDRSQQFHLLLHFLLRPGIQMAGREWKVSLVRNGDGYLYLRVWIFARKWTSEICLIYFFLYYKIMDRKWNAMWCATLQKLYWRCICICGALDMFCTAFMRIFEQNLVSSNLDSPTDL